ncbi:hypothetical protein [Azospirillum sp. TSO22-1]|uniref:hypothetical protein n=1 Tax=Azospirillum sp. TSO22-1 TaxID=716789 RepID=UPI0011B776C2|nr:hypothetical protein [Azospirillum sp. TSO22-1]
MSTLIVTHCVQVAFMARTAAISVRVEEDLKAAVEKAAKEDARTVAQYVERLLISHLREKGLYSPKE